MNTKKNLTIVIIEKNDNAVIAQVTKSFEKRARIYNTEEYKLWRAFEQENPNAIMTTKNIKKNPDKKTTKNLTYENMKLFISAQPKAEERMKEFERQLKISKVQKNPYRAVLAWFLKEFEDYDSYKKFFEELKKKEAVERAAAEKAFVEMLEDAMEHAVA